jgi:hypothetical protein
MCGSLERFVWPRQRQGAFGLHGPLLDIKVTFDLCGHLMPGTEAEAAALLDNFLDRRTD